VDIYFVREKKTDAAMATTMVREPARSHLYLLLRTDDTILFSDYL
jgi:hypothetical protein